MARHGEMSHIEFPADDLERAKAFYSKVFGWEFSAMDGYDNYALYTSGPGEMGGGIGVRGASAGDVVRNYIAVDDVNDAVAKVTASGGTVVTPTTDIGFGWYAAVKDTEG